MIAINHKMEIIKDIIVFFIGGILLIQISGWLRTSIVEAMGVATWHLISFVGIVILMVVVDRIINVIFSRISKRK